MGKDKDIFEGKASKKPEPDKAKGLDELNKLAELGEKDVDLLLSESESLLGKPLRFNDVVDFFKYNLNPSYIQGVIKLAEARAREGKRQFPTEIVLTIGILLVCAGVAYVIIVGAQGDSTAARQLKTCNDQLLQCGSRVISDTTTTTIQGQPGPLGPLAIT